MQKIFTLKEQSIIATSADPFKTVWRLWSMKESAYKVFIQAGGIRFFNPTKIECSLHSLENGQVDTFIEELSKEAEKLCDENFKFLVRSTANLSSKRDYDKCYGLEFIVFIDENGDVFSCFSHQYDKKTIMGNIFEHRIYYIHHYFHQEG